MSANANSNPAGIRYRVVYKDQKTPPTELEGSGVSEKGDSFVVGIGDGKEVAFPKATTARIERVDSFPEKNES